MDTRLLAQRTTGTTQTSYSIAKSCITTQISNGKITKTIQIFKKRLQQKRLKVSSSLQSISFETSTVIIAEVAKAMFGHFWLKILVFLNMINLKKCLPACFFFKRIS